MSRLAKRWRASAARASRSTSLARAICVSSSSIAPAAAASRRAWPPPVPPRSRRRARADRLQHAHEGVQLLAAVRVIELRVCSASASCASRCSPASTNAERIDVGSASSDRGVPSAPHTAARSIATPKRPRDLVCSRAWHRAPREAASLSGRPFRGVLDGRQLRCAGLDQLVARPRRDARRSPVHFSE